MRRVEKTDPDYTVYALKGKGGKSYVGITMDVEKREKQHRSNKEKKEFFGTIKRQPHTGSCIEREVADFDVIILAKDVDFDEACRLEQYWIQRGLLAGRKMCNKDRGGRNTGSFFGKRDSVNNLRYNLQRFFPLCKHRKIPFYSFIPEEIWKSYDNEIYEEWMDSQEREDAVQAYLNRTQTTLYGNITESVDTCISQYESMLHSPEYCEAFDRFAGFI